MLGSSLPTTNAAGEYDLGGLKAGTYRLGFSSTGGYISEYWDDAATVQTATDIVVGRRDRLGEQRPAGVRVAHHGQGDRSGRHGTAGVNVAPYQKKAGPACGSRWPCR